MDEGASAAAADGTELDSAGLLVTGIVDHAVAGSYVLTYNYVDLLGGLRKQATDRCRR